jgi:hypothetical protein
MRTGAIDGKINNLYQVVYDSEELEAATNSVTITDLDGDTDHEYELICRFVNDDGSDSGYYIRFNGDTDANYGIQYLRGNDASAQAGVNQNDNQIYLATSNAAQDYLTFATCHIYAAKNDIRLTLGRGAEDMTSTTPTIVSNISGSWDNKVDNLTSLTVASTQTSGIGIGSRIILLRKTDATDGMQTGVMQVAGDLKYTWQKIFEVTMGSYLEFADSADWDLIANDVDDWTIDFFTKLNDHDDTDCFVCQYEDGDNFWYILHEHGNGIRFRAYWTGSQIHSFYGAEITDSDKHHVALVKKGTEYGIYLDGVQTGYQDDDSSDTLTGPLYIGFTGGTTYLDGRIDEFRIQKSNPFGAAPNVGETDTITVPTEQHTADSNTKLLLHFDGDFDDSGATGHSTTNHNVALATDWKEFGIGSANFSKTNTDMLISGLTGNTDILYRFKCMFRGGSGSNTVFQLRPNNDSGNNYGNQNAGGSSTTELASRSDGIARFLLNNSSITTSHVMFSDCLLYAKSGYERTAIMESTDKVDATTVNAAATQAQIWSNTADEITSFTITADQTNGMGNGSQIELWRLNL